MKTILSPTLVKQNLASHSWIGLMIGLLMYLVCLSGTLLVFYEELERWEQPQIEESLTYDTALIDSTFNTLMMSSDVEITEHMYVDLPGEAIPRVSISTENDGWYVNADGSLGEKTRHEWTQMLTNLHLYLHLPSTWGIIIVSTLGALLCGLIVSGFLAHPRIFRDAFAFRSQNSKRLEQVDLHNRLSVWGAPFHLIIAITGAYFGLALLVLGLITKTSGYTEAEIIETVYGAEPELSQNVPGLAIGRALDTMPTLAPEAQPLFITVHDANSEARFIEVYAQFPDRLIYSENYRFDAEGNYLGRAGFLDEEIGRQAVYSVYRLHFGHFGGFMVKVIYFVLGLALTVVSVSGINIWLERRKKKDYLNLLWPGFVWGTPLALIVSAMIIIFLNTSGSFIFWLVLLASSVSGLFFTKTGNTHRHKRLLLAANALAGIVFLLIYAAVFGQSAFSSAALGPNLILLFYVLYAGMALRKKRTP